MSPNPIAIQRLHSQQLIQSGRTSASDVVRWMGAMQAQEYDMAKWGIGVRLPGSTGADRSASIDLNHAKQAMTGNGIFWPIIVVDGQVIGSWKRAVKPKHVQLEHSFFTEQSESLIRQIQEHNAPYSAYWQLPVRF